jgi:prevent-host-death family protein
MKTHTMTDAKNDICKIIREAEREDVVIMRHGKPAAIVIGFHDEDDWFDYRLENDESFLRRVARARDEIRQGQFVPLDRLTRTMANKAMNRTGGARRTGRIRRRR